jgi:hypothetical protein
MVAIILIESTDQVWYYMQVDDPLGPNISWSMSSQL